MSLDGRLGAAFRAMALKDRDREGWTLRDVDDPESVADHSWGVGLLAVLYGPEFDVDMKRLLELAVVHDIAEYRTGDFVNRVDDTDREYAYEEKHAAEHEAMEQLADDRLMALWQEYEDRDSREAVVLKDLDLLDMCLQALYYIEEGRGDRSGAGFDEFFESADQRLSTDRGRELFEQLRTAYDDRS